MTFRSWRRSSPPTEITRRSRRTGANRTSRRPLTVDGLEDRIVPTAVAPPAGLVSWWTADNTGADLKGLNNATLSNVTYAAGEVGQAFSFNGQNGWAALGDPASLAFTAGFTIEGWVKVNGIPTNYNFGSILFRGDNRGGLDPYQLVIEPNGDLQFGISGTNGGSSIQAPVPTGQWVHVAATLDDATGSMTIYENGGVVAQTTTTARPFGPLDLTQQPGVGIGNSNALSNYDVPLNGLVDELSVYNRGLTAGEVMGIYAAGGAGKINAPTYVAADFPSLTEGSGGSPTPVTFTLRRVGNLGGQTVVNWTTADGTAVAGTDYVAASGQVVFQDGESQKTVTVTVNGDDTPESIETFQLVLSTSTPGYAVGMGQAAVADDDVGISVDDGTATEGDARLGQPMGAFVGRFANGGLNRSTGMAWGPDGNLYVGSLNTNQVLRYDGMTGAFLGVFIDAGSGLAPDGPSWQGLQFRPDGKLYVLSRTTAEVQRFDATTGAFVDTFIPSGSGGLNGAKGMTVGPDGNWYISSGNSNQVLRYSGTTGAFLGVFVTAGSGGVSNPRALSFGPDGNLYVTSAGTNAVLRYNGQTGAFIDAFVPTGSGGLAGPLELLFRNGSLYVASSASNEVIRYDAQTGAFIDKFATPVPGGLDQPVGLLLDSNDNLLVGNMSEILRYGPQSLTSFTARLSIPSVTPVTVDYATADGTAFAGSDYSATSGTRARQSRPSSFRPWTTRRSRATKPLPSTCRTQSGRPSPTGRASAPSPTTTRPKSWSLTTSPSPRVTAERSWRPSRSPYPRRAPGQ
jgi:Concanavalin A-like lectin/glucanases superfamily/Calx-beta domain